MVKKILTGAGFVENKTFKKARFLKPPKTTYAIYLDSYNSRGSDDLNYIKDHDYTIELYSSEPDPEAESRVEAMFDSFGINYDKDDCYWIQEEQLYQVVYTFNHVEK